MGGNHPDHLRRHFPQVTFRKYGGIGAGGIDNDAFCGGNSSHFILEIDEKTSTLLGFDVVDLDKPIKKELLDSIYREGVVIYEKV